MFFLSSSYDRPPPFRANKLAKPRSTELRQSRETRVHSAVEKQKKFVLTASHDYHSRDSLVNGWSSSTKRGFLRGWLKRYIIDMPRIRIEETRDWTEFTTRACIYLFLFSFFSRVLFRTLTNLVALKEHTVYTRLFKGQQSCNKCLGSRYSCHVLACTPSSTSSTAKHSMLLFVLRPLAKAITI